MKDQEFISQVQHRAGLNSPTEAERAIQATFETLGERLAGGEADDLASQLPPEIGGYLQTVGAGTGGPFSLDEFFQRVSLREGVDLQQATFHARVVVGVLTEAVSMGEIEDVRAQLPPEFARLFEVENEGELPEIKKPTGTEPPLVSDMGVDVDHPTPPSKLYTE